MGNPKVDKSLIFYIGEEIYLSLDKGPITERHTQIIPIQHFGSSAMMTTNASEELEKIKKNVSRMFFEEYQQQGTPSFKNLFSLNFPFQIIKKVFSN